MSALFAFFPTGGPGPWELIIVLVIALRLFGKRLPEVARSMGKGIVEFKKGVRGIEDEVENATYASPETSRPVPDEETVEAAAPKFEPPDSEPSDPLTDEDDELQA